MTNRKISEYDLMTIPSKNLSILRGLIGGQLMEIVRQPLIDGWLKDPLKIARHGIYRDPIRNIIRQERDLHIFVEGRPILQFGCLAKNLLSIGLREVHALPEREPYDEREDSWYVPVSAWRYPEWDAYRGRRISSIKIIRSVPKIPRHQGKPCEQALRFDFEGGVHFFIYAGGTRTVRLELPRDFPERFAWEIREVLEI